MARVMEDSMHTHDERQWADLEATMALSAAGDVAIPELEMVAKEEVMEEPPVAAFHPDLVGQGWSWSCSAEQMAAALGAVNWCPTPPQSPERRPRHGRKWCRHHRPPCSPLPPCTTDRRLTCGRLSLIHI